MAYLTFISKRNGNFTDASTWGLVQLATIYDNDAGTCVVGTSATDSNSFQIGANTLDGFALKVASIASSQTGTFTAAIYNVTDSVEVTGTSTTVNVSSMPKSGWFFMKFASPVTFESGKLYLIRCTASNASIVTLYRNTSTSYDFSRMLRLTTEQAPGATDNWAVMGDIGGGTVEVTMNNTGTTDFGTAASTPCFSVNQNGTLTWDTSQATYLKLSGIFRQYDGTINIGTSGSPITNANSATILFDSASAAQFGFQSSGGTLNVYGASKRSWTRLTANAAAAATVLTVADTTGWQVGDTLAISGAISPAEPEVRTIQSVDSATQVTISSGLTYFHYGLTECAAVVANLTRSIKILGNSATNSMHWGCGEKITQAAVVKSNPTVHMEYAQFWYMGDNGTASITSGVNWRPIVSGGSFEMSGCALAYANGTNAYGWGVMMASATSYFMEDFTFSNNASYEAGFWITGEEGYYGVDASVSGNGFVNRGIYTATCSPSFTDNVLGGCAWSFNWLYNMFRNPPGTIARNKSISGTGCTFSGHGVLFEECDCYFATTNGPQIGLNGVKLKNCKSIGCQSYGFSLAGNDTVFDGCTVAGWSDGSRSRIPINAIQNSSSLIGGSRFINCNFSENSGNYRKVSGICVGATANSSEYNRRFAQKYFNCTFDTSGATLIGQGNPAVPGTSYIYSEYVGSFVLSSRHNGTSGSFKVWTTEAAFTNDTTIPWATGKASLRITPRFGYRPAKSYAGWASPAENHGMFKVAAAAGSTPQVSVMVRESVAGDGTDYDGARIRLYVEACPEAGITADTLLATATAASEGAWETLSATLAVVTEDCILNFYVVCGDTGYSQGWINVGAWSGAVNDTKGYRFWEAGGPMLWADNVAAGGGAGGGGGAYTFVG